MNNIILFRCVIVSFSLKPPYTLQNCLIEEVPQVRIRFESYFGKTKRSLYVFRWQFCQLTTNFLTKLETETWSLDVVLERLHFQYWKTVSYVQPTNKFIRIVHQSLWYECTTIGFRNFCPGKLCSVAWPQTCSFSIHGKWWRYSCQQIQNRYCKQLINIPRSYEGHHLLKLNDQFLLFVFYLRGWCWWCC